MSKVSRPFTGKKILHVISHVATPHNNVLMKALEDSGACKLRLYYSVKTTGSYSWGDEIFQAVGKPVELGTDRVHWPTVRHAFRRHEETYLFIGWPNTTARLLLVVFWVLRRPFLFWSDYPNEDWRRYPAHISIFRRFLYHVVKTRAHRIFLVGQHTVDYFESLGYRWSKLVNLPIFIRTDKTKIHFLDGYDALRKRYGVPDGGMLFASGSRLTEIKGYGDLIEAINLVGKEIKKRLRVVIVGKGEQEQELNARISELGLGDVVKMEPWMAPENFERLIACADAYIHPARFDAFGGGTLHAMALGVPVIGSAGAGVVLERVEDRINGLVFPSGNVQQLCACIKWCFENSERLEHMGKAARSTAEKWPPERGAKIVLDQLA